MHRIYSFDQIIINTRQDQQTLKKSLPVDELGSECNSFDLKTPSKPAKAYGYNTAIVFVAPTNNFFKILNRYESILGHYKIYKIEIAEDTIFPDKGEAYSAFMQNLSMTKKWATDYLLYTPSEKEFNNKSSGEGLWSDRTAYYGGKNFKVAVYNRTSKINDKPCLHIEFRLLNAGNIKKRTGIEFIRDFIDYDIKNLFEQWVDKFIKYDEIDILKVGKWLLKITRRRKLTSSAIRRAKLAGRTLCAAWGISNFADFKSYLRKKKAEIKKKKGRKSAFDTKILEARYDYFRLKIK